jgi:hypothetical protein
MTRKNAYALTAALCLSFHALPASASDAYRAAGIVQFRNLQATLSVPGETAPYYGVGISRQLGVNVQTGSILPTSAPTPVGFDPGTNVVTLQFTGMQGTHPQSSLGAVHVIHTLRGDIHCTWTAVFTMELDLDTGDSVLAFRTLFETDVVPAGADSALADWNQRGEISK